MQASKGKATAGYRRSTMRTAQLAVRLADAYPGTVPTVEQLRQDHAMSRATAYRWHAAFRAARRGGCNA